MDKKNPAFFLLFFITFILLLFPLQGKAQDIIITNFINESGYGGNWDIENEFPAMIREFIIRKNQEIPIWRKRSWREDTSDLKRKFPSHLVISGRIIEFSYTSSLMGAWPLIYRDNKAKAEIALEVVNEGEIYTESCVGEETIRAFQLQIISKDETEADELAGIKFGDTAFENSLPGKATRKAIEKCIAVIERYLGKKE
jgi:hypothetical protein